MSSAISVVRLCTTGITWRDSLRFYVRLRGLWMARLDVTGLDICGKNRTKGTVEFVDGTMCETEMHRYEAHGIGAKEYKIKRVID